MTLVVAVDRPDGPGGPVALLAADWRVREHGRGAGARLADPVTRIREGAKIQRVFGDGFVMDGGIRTNVVAVLRAEVPTLEPATVRQVLARAYAEARPQWPADVRARNDAGAHVWILRHGAGPRLLQLTAWGQDLWPDGAPVVTSGCPVGLTPDHLQARCAQLERDVAAAPAGHVAALVVAYFGFVYRLLGPAGSISDVVAVAQVVGDGMPAYWPDAALAIANGALAA